MKKLKSTKRNKMTLMCILLIIAGIVITSICFSKRTMATATKPNCYACGHNGNMEYLAEQSNSDVHAYKCSIHPMVIETASHTGGKHSEGKCSVCSYVYQNHTMEASGYRTLGQGGSHTVIYKCTYPGCTETREGQTEGCTGATHENGGKCEKCKGVYQKHIMETSGYVSTGTGGHTRQLKCSYSGCGETATAETTGCTGGTHENGGECEVCKGIYQDHHEVATPRESVRPGFHAYKIECTYTGCYYEGAGDFEACSGATHDNGGKCEKCKGVYQKHIMETSGYVSTGTGGHTRQLTCSYSGCGETATAETTGCTGGTHENGGECEVCKGIYQDHHEVATPRESVRPGFHAYKIECTYTGCYYEGAGDFEACTGATHANGGKCEKCGTVYQNHSFDGVVGWMENVAPNYDGTHSWERECPYPGCTEREFYKEDCVGGENHENGGLCNLCHVKYINHSLTAIYEYSGDGMHKISYVCQAPICNEIVDYGVLQHCDGASHENGGRCKLCYGVVEEHYPTTKIVGYQNYNTTQHVPMLACSQHACTKLFRGTPENHDIVQYRDNENGTHSDECTICNYKVTLEHRYSAPTANTYSVRFASNNPIRLANNTEKECVDCGALASEADNGCEHSYVEKNDENQHWEECTKCGYLKVGSLKGHEFTAYTDNKDGKHSSTCDSCGYKFIEEHYYEDGVCDDCGVALQECEHEYVLKSDKTNHWFQCSKCDDIRSESTEEHQFETYVKKDEKTHIAICKLCLYSLEEAHDENCDKCTEIKDPDDDENKPGNENNDNNNQDEDKDNNQNNNGDKDDNKDEGKNENIDDDKKDNTIIDTILPNTGASRIVVLVVIVLGIAVAITVFKLKKYKGI